MNTNGIVYLTQESTSSTIPNMLYSTKRFASAFYRGLFGTVRDEILTIAVFVAGGAFWLLHTGFFRGGWSWQSFRANGWEGLGVTAWAVSGLIVYHAIRAAIAVVGEIEQENVIGQKHRVVTAEGHDFPEKPVVPSGKSTPIIYTLFLC